MQRWSGKSYVVHPGPIYMYVRVYVHSVCRFSISRGRWADFVFTGSHAWKANAQDFLHAMRLWEIKLMAIDWDVGKDAPLASGLPFVE
jgi:hypothetical protein